MTAPDPARAGAALGRLAASDRWLDCSDPPHASCADAACPVHGDEPVGSWVTCPDCLTEVPAAGEPCPECGAQL